MKTKEEALTEYTQSKKDVYKLELSGFSAGWDAATANHDQEIKYFELDFGGSLKCRMKIVNNKVEITAAMNGYGDCVPIESISIEEC